MSVSATPDSTPIHGEHGRDDTALHDEIADLERRLYAARLRLQSTKDNARSLSPVHPPPPDTPRNHLHALILLSDSALPLGSFAYSSGLESFLAHHPRTPHSLAPSTQLSHFLALSLNSITATTLPYVIAGYREPQELEDLDNDLDASTPCTVARRASVKQGLALMAVWERSFRAQYQATAQPPAATTAGEALATFSSLIKTSNARSHDDSIAPDIFQPNGHLPPLFGTLCAALSIPLEQALYLYLLNHAKTIISAAIRAGVMGPYQAQGMLAGAELRGRIRGIVDREVGTPKDATGEEAPGIDNVKRTAKEATALAGQSVPTLDLWGGRHEIIYSRIFNS